MDLQSYLEKNELTDAAFAERIGISRPMVTRLRRREANPSAETALKIERETDRAVTLSDLFTKPADPENERAAG